MPTTIIVDHSKDLNNNRGVEMNRKIKRIKKKNLSDYRKNICGYITKKVLR